MAQAIDHTPPGVAASSEIHNTIEMELSAELVLALPRAEAANDAETKPVTHSTLRRTPHAKLAVGVTAIILLICGTWYAATMRGGIGDVAASAIAENAERVAAGSPPPSTAGTPVRFTNPFDVGETFEFPAGTSEEEARDAVSKVLWQRAHDRGASSR